MTNEEAIKTIGIAIAEVEWEYPMEYAVAFEMAIDALKKQIPKKVKYLNRHGDGPDLWNQDYYTCPSCGRRLRNKQHDNHCGRCGQALDWSKGND